MKYKRINIFTGHFGSGKTEVAVNFALRLAGEGNNTAIVDMDIVNPYFRTADVKTLLQSRGIKTVIPVYANTNVDVPALPAEINSLLESRDYTGVFDVGGDDTGARALSRYSSEILAEDYDMFLVINIRRPMTGTIPEIIEMVRSIENSSRLKVTKLVNNSNLLGNTSEEIIYKGFLVISEASRLLGIPLGFTSAMKELQPLNTNKAGSEILYMDKLIRLPWDRES